MLEMKPRMNRKNVLGAVIIPGMMVAGCKNGGGSPYSLSSRPWQPSGDPAYPRCSRISPPVSWSRPEILEGINNFTHEKNIAQHDIHFFVHPDEYWKCLSAL
jgi:hypothetical protein